MSYEPIDLRRGVLEIFQEAQAPLLERARARNLEWSAWRWATEYEARREAYKVDKLRRVTWRFQPLARPFPCAMCGETFRTERGRSDHVFKKHGGRS